MSPGMFTFLPLNIYAHFGRVWCFQLEDRQSKKSNVKFIYDSHDGDWTVMRTALVNSCCVNTRNMCGIHRLVANISCVQKSAYCVHIKVCYSLETVMNEMGHFNLSLIGKFKYMLILTWLMNS
jgi:hypothetical protein